MEHRGYQDLYINKTETTPPYYRVRMGCFVNRQDALSIVDRINDSTDFKSFPVFFNSSTKTIGTKVPDPSKSGSVPPGGKKGFNIEVSNGNGVRHMAGRIGKHLSINGFRIARLTNTSHFNYPETRIFYHKGHGEDDRKMAPTSFGYQKNDSFVELKEYAVV